MLREGLASASEQNGLMSLKIEGPQNSDLPQTEEKIISKEGSFSRISYIGFDLHRTLTDVERIWENACVETVCKIPGIDEEFARKRFRKNPTVSAGFYVYGLADDLRLYVDDEKLDSVIDEIVKKKSGAKGAAFEAVPDALRKLTAEGIGIFVLSNALEAEVKEALEYAGIMDPFRSKVTPGKFNIIGCDSLTGKPVVGKDESKFIAASKLFGDIPYSVFKRGLKYITDDPEEVTEIRNAEIDCWAVSNIKEDRKELLNRGAYPVFNFKDIAVLPNWVQSYNLMTDIQKSEHSPR